MHCNICGSYFYLKRNFLDLFNTFGLDNTIQTAILNP